MKFRRAWGGPGIGWIDPRRHGYEARLNGRLPNKGWGAKFQDALDRLFDQWVDDEIRAGRLPGNQENSMSKFRFPMGALVVLGTSFAAAAKEAEANDREVHETAERQAKRAKDEAYRAAGRSDLIARGDRGTDRKYGALVAMAQPIEDGQVIGRAEHMNSENGYLVRYRAGGCNQIDAWIHESGLEFDPRVDRQRVDPTFFAEGTPVSDLKPQATDNG